MGNDRHDSGTHEIFEVEKNTHAASNRDDIK